MNIYNDYFVSSCIVALRLIQMTRGIVFYNASEHNEI